ncbi:unnamed protein product [Rotaria sordida]|uniref:Histone-lysine N-methyltransferase n=1 Tax=Rotaria sordida TaxID=392033 RepID=A0A814R5N1_9BILA|nr:unnamed protein product [Rotaria sordida]CAF1350229.1 unnamed protein product [Rotaria sordida]
MNEIGTVKTNQKRLYEFEQNFSSKRSKYDEQYDSSTTDTESICSSSDTEKSKIEQNDDDDDDSDIEDFEDNSTISTDQSRYNPVVFNKTILQQKQCLSRHSKKLLKQFKYFYEHSKRKPIESTTTIDDNINQRKKLRWELRNTFNRNDLFKEGYAVLSDESFPFYSLCYMCGSMGNDLIYCNSCCQAYHRACLNQSECPNLCPTPESWLCPNCIVCNICGLVKDSQLISCSDCKRIFHIKCIKQSKDEQQYYNIRNPIWFCPLCIKCDCGQTIISNEQNLLSLTKSFSSQQSLMCLDCLNNMKIIRTNKINQIKKCHLCEKFIEQFITKPKPLFSLTLIGNKIEKKNQNLLQCIKCKHYFHPKCDGYLNEDIILIPYIKNISTNIICSKCNYDQKEDIQKSLINYKLQVIKNTIASITSTLQIMISEENRLNNMKYYMSNLQQLHQSRNQLLNLHAFINDLFIIVQHLLDNIDNRQWQAAINNCINVQCPWFKTSNLFSNNKLLFCSTTNTSINNSNILLNHCFLLPSIDHTYSLNNEHLLFQSNLYKNNLLTSSDSLLCYINNKFENKYLFENLYQIDTRLCQLCQTYADHFSSNISRLISIGINQWIHIGCILPIYSKNLDQSPYILRNIHEIINRCQTKYKCDLCFKMGATVQCYENDCNIRYHCQCIEIYYSKIDRNLQQKLNIINGLLPNLTTLCLKHCKQQIKNNNDNQIDESVINKDINLPKLKSINLSSTVYADLSNTLVEFCLTDIKLCIGSLQIKSLGNFDYLLDNDPNMNIYPNKYNASRVFWSTKNAQQKTIYHLYIEIEQTYHNNKLNHQTIEYPLSNEQIYIQQLYEICEKYFNKFQTKNYSQKKQIINLNNKIEKLTSTSIKYQTSKSILKNIIRSRNKFNNNENNLQLNKSSSIISQENSKTISIDTKTLRNFFTNNSFKSSDHSRFALALVQALQNVDQSLSSAKIQQQQQEPILSYYLSNQTSISSNESTIKKNNDVLLDQLLKNINPSQQLNNSQLSSQLQSTSTINIHNNSTETYIPQIDGNIDNDDEDFLICSSLINSLIEQIINEELFHMNNKQHSINLSHFLSNNINSKIKSISSDKLIHYYQQWLISKYGRIKFTIISDDGYKIVSDNLDDAWLTIVNLVRDCRDDMNLTHLPMSNEELNGHHIFGLTKSIIKIMLNQIYINSLLIEKQTNTILLPLSSSNKNNSIYFLKKKNLNKKILLSNSRLNIYQRKNSQRQRFNWLLNPNRKIEYALKSFEIDDALAYARRILLEECSVSLRLYYLHYFSQRTLIVGSSSIHGCGLFTLIDLIEGQMIIEYTGEVVRQCLTDKRERENEKKGFGCYMFTVDSMNVIDATHQGNKARFINHNCQPNCFAKTVLSGGIKHIIIYALMNITRGSELTYDYSFPEEDIKIPCHCGTNKCRIYLN